MKCQCGVQNLQGFCGLMGNYRDTTTGINMNSISRTCPICGKYLYTAYPACWGWEIAGTLSLEAWENLNWVCDIPHNICTLKLGPLPFPDQTFLNTLLSIDIWKDIITEEEFEEYFTKG